MNDLPQHDVIHDIPVWAKDQIFCRTEVRLSWRDRLKVLLNGRLFVAVETNCEDSPGRVESHSTAYTPPLIKPRETGGYAHEPGEDND